VKQALEGAFQALRVSRSLDRLFDEYLESETIASFSSPDDMVLEAKHANKTRR
jgi:hypothetical protein